MAVHVVKSDGVLALYNGLSASLCRQVRAHSSFNVESLGERKMRERKYEIKNSQKTCVSIEIKLEEGKMSFREGRLAERKKEETLFV